jgi:hypothetical protein
MHPVTEVWQAMLRDRVEDVSSTWLYWQVAKLYQCYRFGDVDTAVKIVNKLQLLGVSVTDNSETPLTPSDGSGIL